MSSSSSNDTNNDPPPLPDIAVNSRRWSETYKEKAIRKINENPWVPLGVVITAGTLIMASVRLRQGNSVKFQHWLRARVGVQALTIFAVLGGLYKYGQANLEENQRIMEQRNQKLMEKKMEQERAELEKRIQDAEMAHKQDELLKKGSGASKTSSGSGGWFGSFKGSSSSSTTPERQTAAPPTPPPPTTDSSSSENNNPSGNSWWRYFGWGGNSSSNSSAEKSSKETRGSP